mgnify:CR=1 FL=1
MGYTVRAIDISQVAINQLKTIDVQGEGHIKAECIDLIEFQELHLFDYLLLDGFFHFNDHDLENEECYFNFIRTRSSERAKMVFCFANHGEAVRKFSQMTIGFRVIYQKHISYQYFDRISELTFETDYSLMVIQR